jgi:DNA polymerase III subunit epsilon
MRQIVLDTETTGISLADGNRLVEVGCVEIINRKLTGNNFQRYINPQRDSEEGALGVHGLTTEFLQDKPLFGEIADELIAFISGAELIIHNAPFDVGFLDHELGLLKDKKRGAIADYCKITDTLLMARYSYPGQRNTLDALCKRLEVDNSHRQLHGALLDAEILADVYLLMTGGQTGLELGGSGNDASGNANAEPIQKAILHTLPVLKATPVELEEHEKYLQFLNDKSKGKCLWLLQEA